jgi:hypothetical protein
MKVFHCDHCGHLVFFENTECVGCGHTLAFLPDMGVVGSLDDGRDGLWHSPLRRAAGHGYRLCVNYTTHQVCNWAVPAEDNNPLCASCRLTRIIPDLSHAPNRLAWYKLEVAKRRLVFTLMNLRLPLLNRDEDPQGGLSFEFKADPVEPGAPRVLTGHGDGVITINIAEADDVERERRRTNVREPYRTLLGHFRHESGHYYWDRLIRDRSPLERFRSLFGDERADYGQSLQTYYDQGAPDDWRERYISAYATAHPWEDWAETWAHYLHMVDTLEIAASCGVSLKPKRAGDPSLPKVPTVSASANREFEDLIASWFPVTYLLNNLNRGLGLADAYPFLLVTPAIEKLSFVHELVAAHQPD